jgi:23S rRNA (cytidine2498-2'-O)-methyltransferase
MLLTCQAGFESLLARELAELHGIAMVEKGPGWLRVEGRANRPGELPGVFTADAGPARGLVLPALAFAHLTLLDPVELRGESVNAQASHIAEFFLTSLRNERIDASWPNIWLGPQEVVGLGRRIGAVETACGELLKKKLSRVAKLAVPAIPRGLGDGRVRGLFVFFADFGRVYVSREAFAHGQRRMANDDLAPSRSYLKIEEAYVLLGREPRAGDTVCDLGAAPGGWSYSAAKRGAWVLAIDNGPLKGGALNHPQIEHRREDAFKFGPEPGAGFDWLFCDMVEEPHHILRNIVEPWLARRWCRSFIVNLKFGRVDPVGLLRELRTSSPFAVHASATHIRHLYHDREEFTAVGEVNP